MHMLYGVLNLSFWGYFVAFIILTQTTIASVTLYLHRNQTHRAMELHPIVSHFFRVWLWLTTGMLTKDWVAIHRKHHARCETEEDPHSPQIKGLRKVLFEGSELYRAEAKNKETIEKYGYGTPDDWMERNVYSRHPSLGILLMFIFDIILFGIPGITMWAIQMSWIPFFAAGVVNGIGHYWGYRNFECPDAARNVIPWGLFIGGEELHNNHHAFASSARFSQKPWEFDLGWMYIRVLQFFGLAKVKRLPPKLKMVPTKLTIDAETLKASVANRFQITQQYYREVVIPVFKEERLKAGDAGRNAFKRVKKLMIREESLMRPKDKQRLSRLLENRDTLVLVYQYRKRLQEIWSRASANQKEAVEALREWCKQAEETGIEVLQHFAAQMRQFAPAPVL